VIRWPATFLLCVCALIILPASAARADEAEDVYNFATGLLIKKDYALALDEYAAFLKKHPNHAKAKDAAFRRAECLYRLGRHAEAEKALADFARRHAAAAERPVALWWRGDCLLQLKRYAEAAGAYGVLARDFPDHDLAPAARYWQGESLLRAGQTAKAVPILRAAAKSGDAKHAPLALAGLGWAEFTRGRYAEAVEHFDALLRQYPDHDSAPEAAVHRAEALENLGRRADAEAAYAALEKKHGRRFGREILLGRARLAFAAESFTRAAGLFERAAAQSPKHEDADSARFNAASAWYRAGEFDKATARFADLAKKKGAHQAQALYWQAKSAAGAGAAAKAETLFERALAAAGTPADKARAGVGLGDARQALGHPEAAAAAYLKALADDPRGELADAALYSAALAQADAGKLEAAAALCRRLLRDWPRSSLRGRAEFALGEFLFRGRDFASASTTFASLAKAPREGVSAATVAARLAWCAYEQKQARQARRLFAQVLKQHPKSPEAAEAAFMLGRIAADAGDYAAAADAFEKCRTDYPAADYAGRAAVEAGAVLLRQGKGDQAAKVLAGVLKDRPDSAFAARARLFLAEAQLEAGDAAGALKNYDAVIAAGVDASLTTPAQLGAGHALRAQKKFREAAGRFDIAAGADPGGPGAEHLPAALFWAGRSLEDAGEAKAAEARYARVLREHARSDLADDAAWRLAALRARSAGNIAAAARIYNDFIGRYPQSEYVPGAIYDLAWSLAEAGRKKAAAAEFERLLKAHPDHALAADAAFRLGEMRYDARDYVGAVAYYQRVRGMKGVPFLDKVIYKQAWAWRQLGKPDKALAAFRSLATGFPESTLASEAAFRAGRILHQGRQLDEAAKLYGKVGADLADRACFQLGQIDLARGNWAAARERFSKALAEYPKSAVGDEMRLGLGTALLRIGAYEDAERELRAVIRATETVTAARAQYGLGEIRFARKDYSAAGREFLKVAILYGYDEWKRKALLMAARSYDKAGDAQRAGRYCDELIKAFPKSAEAGEARGLKQRLAPGSRGSRKTSMPAGAETNARRE